MTVIEFDCDRCGARVRGIYHTTGTGGFYNVSQGHPFAKYGRHGETFVCDACIQSMPEYQNTYKSAPMSTYRDDGIRNP